MGVWGRLGPIPGGHDADVTMVDGRDQNLVFTDDFGFLIIQCLGLTGLYGSVPLIFMSAYQDPIAVCAFISAKQKRGDEDRDQHFEDINSHLHFLSSHLNEKKNLFFPLWRI